MLIQHKSFRLEISVLAVIFTILSVSEAKRSVRWIKSFDLKFNKSFSNVILIIVLNLMIPTLVCKLIEKFVCYKVYQSPLIWMPDLVYATMVFPITLFITGLIKIAYVIKKKYNYSDSEKLL